MSEELAALQRKLDPWSASSLLQKAIRRREAELAVQAATLFREYRGNAIWRRLITISVEDVGIADLDLVHDVTRLGTDKMLRSVLGSEDELVADMCGRLSSAPKDRSADYLFSAATSKQPGHWDEAEPLVRQAATLLRECTSAGNPPQLIEGAVRQYLSRSDEQFPDALQQTVLRLVRSRAHPFVILLLPLWSALRDSPTKVVNDTMPATDIVSGVPLYTFDKHTAVGKQAIIKFALDNRRISGVLASWAPPARRAEAALMAAFYADGVPVSRRLEWPLSQPLFLAGRQADIASAGYPGIASTPIVDMVRAELPHLNEIRRSVFLGGWRKP